MAQARLAGFASSTEAIARMPDISRWHLARNHVREADDTIEPATTNLVATALVLGQIVAQQSPSLRLIAAGLTAWIGFVSLALWLIGED